MPIIKSALVEKMIAREWTLQLAREAKGECQDGAVVDVGGSADSWSSSVATHLIDIIDPGPNSALNWIPGDINSESFWRSIGDNVFDFAICSHVLEDIRSPQIALAGINRTAKRGIIIVPNAHTEFSNVESSSYLGFLHHRWILTIADGVNSQPVLRSHSDLESWLNVDSRGNTKLLFFPKLTAVAFYNMSRFKEFKYRFLEGIWCFIRRKRYYSPKLYWFKRELARQDLYQIYYWENSVEFETWNNDFAGLDKYECLSMYKNI